MLDTCPVDFSDRIRITASHSKGLGCMLSRISGAQKIIMIETALTSNMAWFTAI